MKSHEKEIEVSRLVRVSTDHFNPLAKLPCGCTVDHVRQAMNDYLDFLETINQKLVSNSVPRLESILMPANFSSIVGEFCGASIPKYCPTIVKNLYHNGHPDLIPANRFSGDAVQHSDEGIEIKASRYEKNWQGHNAEDCWLMVFVFDSNRPADPDKGISPRPFKFLKVVGAQLKKSDWKFAGRSAKSRRTITASVTNPGYDKMMANWIYQLPGAFGGKER